MPQSTEIDLNEICKEITSDSLENCKRWIKLMECNEVSDRFSKCLEFTYSQLPPLELVHPFLLPLLKEVTAFSFELGRLYGRTEVTRELMGDIE